MQAAIDVQEHQSELTLFGFGVETRALNAGAVLAHDRAQLISAEAQKRRGAATSLSNELGVGLGAVCLG
jgi:hypothetical protein